MFAVTSVAVGVCESACIGIHYSYTFCTATVTNAATAIQFVYVHPDVGLAYICLLLTHLVQVSFVPVTHTWSWCALGVEMT